jgi:hypothetical protein
VVDTDSAPLALFFANKQVMGWYGMMRLILERTKYSNYDDSGSCNNETKQCSHTDLRSGMLFGGQKLINPCDGLD